MCKIQLLGSAYNNLQLLFLVDFVMKNLFMFMIWVKTSRWPLNFGKKYILKMSADGYHWNFFCDLIWIVNFWYFMEIWSEMSYQFKNNMFFTWIMACFNSKRTSASPSQSLSTMAHERAIAASQGWRVLDSTRFLPRYLPVKTVLGKTGFGRPKWEKLGKTQLNYLNNFIYQ